MARFIVSAAHNFHSGRRCSSLFRPTAASPSAKANGFVYRVAEFRPTERDKVTQAGTQHVALALGAFRPAATGQGSSVIRRFGANLSASGS